MSTAKVLKGTYSESPSVNSKKQRNQKLEILGLMACLSVSQLDEQYEIAHFLMHDQKNKNKGGLYGNKRCK